MQWSFRHSGQTGEKALINKRMGDGQVLDLDLYDEIRDTLIGCGWAVKRNWPRGGWRFVSDKTAAQIIAGLQRYREER